MPRPRVARSSRLVPGNSTSELFATVSQICRLKMGFTPSDCAQFCAHHQTLPTATERQAVADKQWAPHLSFFVAQLADFCVVVCVVTLPSMPISVGLARSHSGKGKRQGTCVKPA